MPRVIAVDGPAASGKSSTAQAVARRLGWAHLDSGALYRALTLATLDNTREAGSGTRDAWSGQKIVALAEELPVRLVLVGDVFRPEVAGVAVEEAIRSDRVTRRVSEIAAIPEVRRWVNARQREAVQRHPRGVVVDGRDIGTVVFPDADVKFFLTASSEERARRRFAEEQKQVAKISFEETFADMNERDRRDSTRADSPLLVANDAIVIDSTGLRAQQVFERMMKIVCERTGHGPGGIETQR